MSRGRPRLVVLVMLVLAALVAAGCGGAGSGSGTAAATPAASSAGKVLPGGTYSSLAFTPTVTYTVPDGWEQMADSANFFQLRPFGSEVATLNIFANPRAAIQDAACTSAPDPKVGTTSSDLAAWIKGLPGLTVTTPAMTTVGGFPGQVLDLHVKDGWNQSCPFANGLPTVPVLSADGKAYQWVVYGTERLRLYLIDLPKGTVAIGVDTIDPTVFDQLVSQAAPIIKSLQFKTGS